MDAKVLTQDWKAGWATGGRAMGRRQGACPPGGQGEEGGVERQFR